MKTEYKIEAMIREYTNIIDEYYSQPEDRDERDRLRAKIDALKWVLEEK